VNAYEDKTQAWWNEMAAYRRGTTYSHLRVDSWLPVHRGQLRAQRLVTSMGEFYLYLTKAINDGAWYEKRSLIVISNLRVSKTAKLQFI